MPKNFTGGNKAKSKANKLVTVKKNTLYATEPGMMYGKIVKKLGGTHMKVMCNDGIERIGKIPGAMRKRKWINVNDIILLSLREFSTNQDHCDILYCYDYDESKNLLSLGEISFELTKQNDDHDNSIRFTDDINEISDDDDPLNDDSSNDADLPVKTNTISIEPVKTGKAMKSRNNKRDEKISRIEGLTHEEQ
jgi:translation initiation factor 1A